MFPIEINGKTYQRFEDLSPEEQKNYEKYYGFMGDKDGNGQSDFMDDEYCQSLMNGSLNGVVFRGVTYKSFAEMPEDVRAKMQHAFNSLFPMGLLNPHVCELLLNRKFI